MKKIKILLHAARLRTLPLSLSSIIAGNAIAYYLEACYGWTFFLSILTTLLLQILSNFSNDLGDSEKGTDNSNRLGPIRAVQSGIISDLKMKRWIKISILLTLISGLTLVLTAHMLWWEKLIFILLGISAIAAAILYTQSKYAYGYRGYGDLFVFLFFGIVGVMGSLYLQIHHLSNSALLVAIGVGLLSTSVLHLNNMRDRINDKESGKITLSVRLGKENSKIYFLVLILVGVITWACFVFTQEPYSYFSFLYWIGFVPFLFVLKRFFKIKNDQDYDALLRPVALSIFATSILFFISQLFIQYV